MQVEDLRAFVKEKGIDAEFIEHQGSDGLTSEAAASAIGIPLSKIIKVLCFVDKKANKCFAIIPGDKKVDTSKLPGMKKARIATAQELSKWFGFEPGCIPPICLPDDVQKYVDSGVKGQTFVVGSAESRFVGLKINPEQIINQKNTFLLDVATSA